MRPGLRCIVIATFILSATPGFSAWTWSYPQVQSNTLDGICMTGAEQFIAVGEYGSVTIWDNGLGRVLPTATRQHLRAVWGTGPDYFLVAGDNGVVLLWNGQIWQGIASQANDWRSMWGASPTCVFLGGNNGEIGRWDGGSTLQYTAPAMAKINAISGASADDVFAAAGFSGLLHWDGTAWSAVDTGFTYVFDVWSIPEGPTLVLGSGGETTMLQGHIGQWTPLFSLTSASPLRFGGTGIDDLFIQGEGYGLCAGNAQLPPPPNPYKVGFAWDGAELRTVPWRWADSCRALSKQTGANVIVGCGERGTWGYWDGTDWSMPCPDLRRIHFHDLWAESSGALYITGVEFDIFPDIYIPGEWTAFVNHLAGSVWDPAELSCPEISLFDNQFPLTLFTSPSDRLLAGVSIIEHCHWNGSGWTAIPFPDDEYRINDAAGPAAGEVILAGQYGRIYEWNGESWTLEQLPTIHELRAACSNGSGNAWIVGEDGEIWLRDGEGWVNSPSSITHDLNGVWASGPDEAYAAGDNGTLLRWDGAGWWPIELEFDGALFAVTGNESGLRAVTGENGAIFELHGESWWRVDSPIPSDLTRAVTYNNDIYAMSPAATVLRRTSDTLELSILTPCEHIIEGDAFSINGRFYNPGSAIYGARVFFILDVWGEFYFWPSWSHYMWSTGAGIDWSAMDIASGMSEFTVVPPFVWPSGAGTANGLLIHAAASDEQMTVLLTDIVSQYFSYDS